jgi:hypothetical protein
MPPIGVGVDISGFIRPEADEAHIVVRLKAEDAARTGRALEGSHARVARIVDSTQGGFDGHSRQGPAGFVDDRDGEIDRA